MGGILGQLVYALWTHLTARTAFISYQRGFEDEIGLPPAAVDCSAGDAASEGGGSGPPPGSMFKHRDKDSSKSSNSNSSSSLNDGSGYYMNPGINNLGNSCFLNSVIQGLAASRPLRDALAAYPGAERALKASHTTQPTAPTGSNEVQAGSGAASSENAAVVPDKPDTGEMNRISAVADQQRQGLDRAPTSPSVMSPGTPTTETSPSLQLLTEDPFPDNLPLSSALASTLVKLWNGKQSTINVKNLMRELNRKNEDWNEWDQMDAHELLRFLLDGISMEEIDLIKKLQPQPEHKGQLKKKKRKGPRPVAEQLRRKAAMAAGENLSSSESEDSSSDEDDMSTSEAESLLAEDPTYRLPPRDPPPPRYQPFIDTIFGGKLASVIVCEECRGVSRIEEDFLDISLPIKGDDGKVRRRDRLRKFLGSSSSNLKQESERPRLAPRAPTNILNPSESEYSESEDGGATSALDMGASSNASISSGGAAASSSIGGNTIDRQLTSSKEETEDEREARVRRRKSLDPHPLRSPSPLRGILGSNDAEKGRTRERSLLARGASLRVGGNNDSSKTIKSDKSKVSDVSTRKKSKQSHLLAKPTKEQQDYIRQLFAEIPLPASNPSPLAHLRVAQPGGQHSQFTIPTPTAAETNGSPLAMADASETGLYQCLVQFTSVELLEGENAFQCRRCWKLLHPELVAQVGRKRAAKAVQKKEEAENKQLSNLKNRFPDDTPRGSISAGSDLQAGRSVPGESMISVNRKLLAERERQLAEARGDVTPAASSASPDPSSGTTNMTSQTPNIMITANSPPVSPQGTSGGSTDPLHAGFSQLSVSESRASSGSASAPASHGSLGLPTSSMSDLGAEADEEDRSDVSDHEHSNGDVALDKTGKGSPDGVVVSPAHRTTPSAEMQVGIARPNPSRMQLPTLPPRSQRFIPRRAHKRYLISSLPPILVLHLKRFQQTHKSMFSSFGDLKKLDDKVTFPLYLDMAPFMAPPPLSPTEPSAVEKALASGTDGHSLRSGDESDNSSKKNGDSQKNSKSWFRRSAPSAEMRSNCVYRLYAVIVHKGSMGSGHYVAMTYTSQRRHEGVEVKAPTTDSKTRGQQDPLTKSDHEAARQWIYCSDHVVRPASVDEVFKSQAYLLMYERIDPSERPPAKM